MLNTIFNCLTAKRNTSPVLAFQVTPKDRPFLTGTLRTMLIMDIRRMRQNSSQMFFRTQQMMLMFMRTLISETCGPQTI